MVLGPLPLDNLVSPSIAAEVRRIELRTRRTVSAEALGRYRSLFRGSGLTFADLRSYIPGDEIKNIHWKATARTGKVQVKSYDEERHLNVIVAVDLSPSTLFGAVKSNNQKALEFAALIALLARTSGDAVGLLLFGERVLDFVPPQRARTQVQRIILKLLEAQPLTGATDIAGALTHLAEHQRRAALIFVVSDFVAPPFGQALGRLALRHDVVLVALRDPLDAALPAAGLVTLTDPESGVDVVVDTSAAGVKAALEGAQSARLARVANEAMASGATLIEVENDPVGALSRLMRRRAAQRR